MKKIVFLLGLVTIVSCSSDKASNGNPGPIPGNSDKKIHKHEAHEAHGETTVEIHGTAEESHAEADVFHFNEEKATLTFTAYKFPGENKKGVKGTFKTINVKGAKDSEHAEEVLEGAEFSIPVVSVSTKDIGRDGRLKEFFFGNLSNTADITGKFGKFEENKVPVTLKLNDKEVTKTFQYQIADRTLNLIGKIDIVKDFGASKALSAINEACKELHEGKTWSDVDLKVNIEL